jgi:hypothetical protein
MVKNKHDNQALRLLNRKIRVTINDRYILPSDNAIFSFLSSLDFFAAIPRNPGLSVILPPKNIQTPAWWTFSLDFRHPQRPFHFKHGKLGFRPDQATCYIGSTGSLDIWVIYVLDEKLEEDAKTLPAGSTFTNPSQLSTKHFRQLLSWFLYCLSKINYPGLHLRSDRRYSVNLDHSTPNWSFVADFKSVPFPPFTENSKE